MTTLLGSFAATATAVLVLCGAARGGDVPRDPNRALRLVPFPKHVQLGQGRFALKGPARIVISDSTMGRQVAGDLKADLVSVFKIECSVSVAGSQGALRCWLGVRPDDADRAGSLLKGAPNESEGYVLNVDRSAAVVVARTEAGLVHGIETLRQLIRANCREGSIPCVTIRDWPSLRYRGFSDDITRGPSPKLSFLKREVRAASLLRMNFLTYYLEYQYAYKKHPLLGPKDGSLAPEELKVLVGYAKCYGVEIIGNQQSFGHFGHILKHEAYKHLRETPDVLNPTDERTYALLDDMYSEQAPLLASKFFNVCCDETWGLGTGPSKALAEKIGVGGVYANHLVRVHDLLRDKYGKRMMMWGDIIIKHPEHLARIPKDTIVLSWGYHAAASFDEAITPFSKSGYEFFVCPGVSCWSRILPDFGVAITNIHNYVRDGAKHGALGMLNTTWDDDGENLTNYNWHGVAWGAECAWNASKTLYEDFSRRVGGVLFGEPDDHFGQAIDLLAKTHRLPGYDNMLNRRFWKEDFGKLQVDERSARRQATALLDIVRPALEHLRTAQSRATVNAAWLDYYIFGAERMQVMATRVLDYIDAARAYEQAAMKEEGRIAALELAERKVRKMRDDHAGLRNRFVELWHRESKPYALDWTTRRYDRLIAAYDKMLEGLAHAGKAVGEKRALPSAEEVGLVPRSSTADR